MNMVARITHTQNSLETNLTGHSYQAHHSGCPVHCLLCVGMPHLAGKVLCPHSHSLNNWNVLILVAIVSADLLWCPQQRSLSPCLPIAHHTVHFAEWRWKWASSPNHRQSKVVVYCYINFKTSRQNSCFCGLLATVRILPLGDFLRL
jgi:hypothetical protein